MGTLQSFTELECWRASRAMVKAVYQVSAQGSFARDFGLRDQIRKAAISAMSNIAEGFERGSRKENIHFLRVAKASVAEVESQLYAALDVGYLRPAEFGKLLEEATSAKRLIAGFIHYLLKCETSKPTNPQTNKPTNQQTNKPTNQQTNKPTNQQTSKPTNPQTNKPGKVR